MADLPVQPITDYTPMLSGLTNALVNQNESQARTGLINRQALGAGMANQKTAMQLDLYREYLKGFSDHPVNDQGPITDNSGVSGVTGALTGGKQPHPQAIPTDGSGDPTLIDAGLDPAHIADIATKNYAVRDIWKPQELAALHQNQMGIALGMPDMTQSIKLQHDAGITSAKNKAEIEASTLFDKMYAVSSSPHPLKQLEMVSPEMADAVRKAQERNGWTDAQADAYAKTYGDEVGNAVHRYSNRPVEVGKDGIARDKETGKPLPGAIPEGVSPEEWSKSVQDWGSIVTTVVNGRETPVPKYRLVGASNAVQAANMAIAAQQRAGAAPIGATGPAGGAAPIGATGPAGGAAPAAGGPLTSAVGATPVTRPAPAGVVAPPGDVPPTNRVTPIVTRSGVAPTTPAPQATAPAAGKAPGLTPEQQKFVASGPSADPIALGNTGGGKPTPADTARQTDYVKARTTLLADADEMAQTAQSSLTNVKRIESIMAKDPPTGPGSGTLAAVGTFLQSMRGRQAADLIDSSPALRQLLEKELSQDQLNGILTKFHGEGAQVRLGAQESKLILGAMSANPDLSKGAIKQMLDWERTDSQYNLQKARVAREWVRAGKDPQQFNYEDAFPRPSIVGTTLDTPDKARPAPPTRNAKGGVLHRDAHGNYAYKNPDGTYEEVK